jgi:hypothetical protein
MRPHWLATAVVLVGATRLPAQVFIPIAVSGYTQDVIADPGGNATITTSATFDSPAPGAIGENHVLYAKGFNLAAPTVGVPPSGTLVAAVSRSYQLGPIAGNNDLQLDTTHRSGALSLTTPARFSKISLLLADGNGNQPSFVFPNGETGSVQVNWSDSTSSSHTFIVYDWFLLNGSPSPSGNSGVVISALDRARRDTGVVDNNSTNPCLFYYDVDLSADASFLSGASMNGITVTWPGGPTSTEVTNVMGLSGVSAVPEPSSMSLLGAVTAVGWGLFHRRRTRQV